MSDSEELLFGNITDADADPSQDNKSNDGTSYPQHLTTVAMESDSDSHNRSYSNDAIQIKKCKLRRKLKKSKSRKRIKDIIINPQSTTNNTLTLNNNLGENNNNNNDNIDDMVDIDPSSSSSLPKKTKCKNKKPAFLNGKTKKSKHHQIVSIEDSDDEDDEEDDDDKHINNDDNKSCLDKMKYIIITLKRNGHILSLILTLIVIITIIGSISGDIAAIIIFLICYIIYLFECYINRTWKDMAINHRETACDATIKLLDTLRNTPPVIDWYVECYHYETTTIPPLDNKKLIVWVHGKKQNGGHIFEDFGFDIKYFKWDWNAINFVADKQNQKQICSIILPSGYQGNRIQKSMLQKFNNINNNDDNDEKVAMQIHDDDDHDDDDDDDIISGEHKQSTLDIDDLMDNNNNNNNNNGNIPIFFRWNGDIDKLVQDFKNKNVIKEDKKKIVTHTNSMIYDYNEWNDISLNYPNFDKHEITKLSITKTYCLLNKETRNDYDEQKQDFLTLNNKDQYQSFHEKIDIRGFKNCLTIKKQNKLNGNIEATPFWYTITGYWIYSIFLFTLYPRYKTATMFGKTHWKIIKSISI